MLLIAAIDLTIGFCSYEPTPPPPQKIELVIPPSSYARDAGVDAADRVDLLLLHAAALGDRADEPAVHVLQLVEEHRALLLVVRAEVALDIGALAALVRVGRDPDL